MTLHPSTPPPTSPMQLGSTAADGQASPGTDDSIAGEPLHIALVGMPGAGKTTVGRLVAEKMGLDFVDLDEVIAEAANKPLTALFAEQGETMFRAHERRHMRALLRRERPMVLSCGGGTWADAAMRRELLAHARPVLLEASFETLLERLEASNERHLRPLLAGPDPKAALERLWRVRHDVHALCPRHVSTMQKSAAEVADAVVLRLNCGIDAERMARAQQDLQALASQVAVSGGQRREQASARAGGRTPGPGGQLPRASHAPAPLAKSPGPVDKGPRLEGTAPTAARLGAPLAFATPKPADALAVPLVPSAPAPQAPEPQVAEAAAVAQTPAASQDPSLRSALDAPPAEALVAAPDDAHDDAFGTFLQQDIEAFAVPLASLAHEPTARTPAAMPLEATDARAPDAPEPATAGEVAATPFLRVSGRLGDYPIYVLDADANEGRAAEAVAEQIDAHSHGTRIAIVSDTEVASRHASGLRDALRARGLAVSVHTFAAGEESKRLSTAHGLYDELADAGHGREDTLVALGGGVVTDLTGFVASTYMRGVPLVQVPTSTLAAVDACIGGKTGLNTNRGKNLVGTFFAPQAVVISTAYLRTQSERAHVAGLVEAAKVAALQDAALLQTMLEQASVLAEGEPTILREVIGRALMHKAAIVERDELERGERALLNYGHTFGHAIEVGEGFGRLHGEAVALGMLAEAEWAEMNGHAKNVSKPLAELLVALGIPTEWRAARVDLDALGRDKKRMGDTLKLPVVSAIGQAHLTAVALDDLIDFAQATMLPSVRWSR